MPPSREWPQQEYAGEVALVVAYGTATDNVGFHYEKIDQIQCLSGPAAFTFDPRGGWYVADVVNGVLKRFSEDGVGRVMAQLDDPPGLYWAFGTRWLTAGRDGTVYMGRADAVTAIAPDARVLWVLRSVEQPQTTRGLSGPAADGGPREYALEQLLAAIGPPRPTGDPEFASWGRGFPNALGVGIDGAVLISTALRYSRPDEATAGVTPWIARLDRDGTFLGTVPSCHQDACGVYYATWLPPDYGTSPIVKAVPRWDREGLPLSPVQIVLPGPPDPGGISGLNTWLVAPDGSLFGIGDYKRDASGGRPRRMVIKYSPEGAEVARFTIRPVRPGIMSCYCIGPDGAFWTWEDVGDKLGFVCYTPKAGDAGAK